MLPVEIAQIFPARRGAGQRDPPQAGREGRPERRRSSMLYSPSCRRSTATRQDQFDLANAKYRGSRGRSATWATSDPPTNATSSRSRWPTPSIAGRRPRTTQRQSLDQQSTTWTRTGPGTSTRRRRASSSTDLDRPFGESRWTVLNDDRRENLHRPHGPAERGAAPRRQRRRGLARRAEDPAAEHRPDSPGVRRPAVPQDRDARATGKKYLDVDVLLSQRGATRAIAAGSTRTDVAAQAVPEQERARRDRTGRDRLREAEHRRTSRREQWVPRRAVRHRAGGPHVKIRCGDHALGYSLFHGVWEWFYEKVVFFF